MDACVQASTKTLRIQSTLATFEENISLVDWKKKEVYKVWLEFLVDACVQASTKASYFFNFFLLDWFLQTCFLSNLFRMCQLCLCTKVEMFGASKGTCRRELIYQISKLKMSFYLFTYLFFIYLFFFAFIDLFKICCINLKYLQFNFENVIVFIFTFIFQWYHTWQFVNYF